MKIAIKENYISYLLIIFILTSLLAFFKVNYALTTKYILIIFLSLTFIVKLFYKSETDSSFTNILLAIFFISFFVLDFIFFVQLNLSWLYFFQILFTGSSILFTAILIYGLLQKKNHSVTYFTNIFTLIIILILHYSYLSIPQKSLNKLTKLNINNDTSLDKDLSALEAFLVDHNVIGASVGLIKDNNIYYYSYGTLDKNTIKSPNPTSLFQIASISKVFTGLLLSKAIIEDKIRLNDSVKSSLDVNRNDDFIAEITYKQLVTNTSGIPDLTASGIYWKEFIKSPLDPYKSSKVKQFTEVINTISISQDSKYEYSNVGFSLLAYALADIYNIKYNNGIGYNKLLQKEVSSILGLENTTYFPSKNHTLNLSKAYSPLGFELPHWEHHMYHGAGGLYSTAEDLAKLIQLQMSVNDSKTNKVIDNTHKRYFQDDERTLGMPWNIESNGEVFWFTGYSFGNTSYIGFNKETNTGIVILLNTFILDIAKFANQLLMDN